MLFAAWCVPYNLEWVPEYLRSDPVKAYGQYAFESGFKLGMSLAVVSLEENMLARQD